MAIQVPNPHVISDPRRVDTDAPRRARPVLWLAAFGAFFIAVQAYAYGRWILSGNAVPVKNAINEVGLLTKTVAWVSQAAVLVVFVALVFYVVRQSRRAGRVSFDAMLLMAWVLASWQDTALNFFRMNFFYNSYFLNLGTWDPYIWGWVSPNAENIPSPALFLLLGYGATGLGWILAINAIMRGAQRRFPRLGFGGMVAIAFICAAFFDAFVEIVWVRTGLFSYGATISELSLFAGSQYQWPLYEGVLWGLLIATTALVRFYKDDRGGSVIERGLDEVKSPGRRGVARFLAFVGAVNLVFVLYNLLWGWTTFYVDETVDLPRYLMNNICGEGTPYPCAGPNDPIPLR